MSNRWVTAIKTICTLFFLEMAWLQVPQIMALPTDLLLVGLHAFVILLCGMGLGMILAGHIIFRLLRTM